MKLKIILFLALAFTGMLSTAFLLAILQSFHSEEAGFLHRLWRFCWQYTWPAGIVPAILAKVGIAGVNSNVATAIRTTVVLFISWIIAIPALRESGLSTVSRRTWLFLILSGVGTGLSWLCYFRALQLGKASQVAPVDKLSVVVAIALAGIFLGERLSWQEGVGAALIIAGVISLALK
jgi:transporter family protein